MCRNGSNQNEKGFMLITAFLFAAVLSTAALGLATRQVAYLQAAERNKNRMVAFNMAEAAMDTAINQLATNPNYAGTTAFTSLSTGNIQGGYSVVVCPPACTGLTTPTDPNTRLIAATGQSPSNITTTTAYEARALNAYVTVQPKNSFLYAIFSKNSISLTGNAITDSYDSSVAAYNPGTATSNGDVVTDSTSAGAVSLSGDATVKGNAAVGPNGNANTVITTSGNAVITGTKSAQSSAQNPQAMTTAINSEGTLSVSGNTTYSLAAGTHRFSSISVSGNAKINALGAVIIYVDGTISISGNGFATQANKPTNLLIYVTGSSNVSISGNGNFYGAIHAPNSSISNTGNGSIYGAMVGKNYTQTGNGAIHYDKALQNSGSSNAPVHLQTWIEKNAYY